MFSIEQYKPINKGPLVASFNVKVIPWNNIIIRNLTYFVKGNQRWISLPSKEYEAEGKRKFYSYITFEDQSHTKEFLDRILAQLDIFLKANPQPDNSNQDLPF